MSLRKAINEKCRECIYDPMPGLGNWKQQVSACTSPDCPLFPVRPQTKPTREKVAGGTKTATFEHQDRQTV